MIYEDVVHYFECFKKNITKDNKSLRKQLKFLGVRYRAIIPNMSRNVHVRNVSAFTFKDDITLSIDIAYTLNKSTPDYPLTGCYQLNKKIKTIKFLRHVKIGNINL